MNWKSIQLPLTDAQIEQLRAGDAVHLTGTVLTARDRSLAIIEETVQKNQPLPVEFKDAVIYFAGPTPAPPGRIVGSVGPTTSDRMMSYIETILKCGVKGFIGKGRLHESVHRFLQKYKAVYFTTYGGAGAYLSQFIVSSKIVGFEELGPEALYCFEIKNFPVFVANDIYNGDIHANALQHR